MNLSTRLLSLALFAGALPLPAAAQLDAGIKLKGAAYDEDPRDLGLAPGGTPEEGRSASYLDLGPYVRIQAGEDTAFYVRTQLFASAGDPVVQNEDELPVANEEYAALRELWLEYGGITSFPGEVLRLGLQRVKEPDGLWWDRDVESVRWIFDTTLVQAQLGVAEQFGTYRSDDVELSPGQRDRAYVFASYSRQWRPGYYNGIRAAYAQDHGTLPGVGETIRPDTKTQDRDYLWVALRTDNGYYDPRSANAFTYWAEAILLAGRRESANRPQQAPGDPTPPPDTVDSINKTDVAALATDLGLRVKLPLIFPMSIGATAAVAEGDRSGGTSHVFEQTGLESNRSRFTGTRTLIHRFNEALEANWSNLIDTAAFVSFPGESADASFIWHKFRRQDGDEGFSADGLDVQPVNGESDLGSGMDFVLTTFFRNFGEREVAEDDDSRSNVRLRASRFMPGAAYGDSVDDLYKVTLELTLWF